MSNPFILKENEYEIEANSRGSAMVKFKPFEPNFYFFQILQCFIYMINGNENKMRKIEDTTSAPKVTLSRA